jgi:hypothetical protein
VFAKEPLGLLKNPVGIPTAVDAQQRLAAPLVQHRLQPLLSFGKP